MAVEFSNDPDRIASLRAQQEERRPADRLERFLRGLPEKYDFSEADRALLRERRDEAVPRLLEIAGRDRVKTVEGAAAIKALCILEEEDVLPIARKALRARKTAWRHALMDGEASFLGTDAEIRRILLEDLDSTDPQVVGKAVQECGILELPGALERFAELIRRPDAPARPRMAYWLCRRGASLADLAAIEAAWLDDPSTQDEDAAFVGAVAIAAREGADEARRAAVEILLRWFALVRDGVRPFREMPGTIVVADAFDALRWAAPEDPRCAAMAADLVLGRSRLVEVFLKQALDVVAAGDPARHRGMALAMLQQPDGAMAVAVAESLGHAYAGAGDAEVVAAIRAARVQHGESERFNEALARVGGGEADAAAEAGPEESSMSRMRVLWRTRKVDPQAALDRMAAVGALRDAEGLAEAARRSLREVWPDREPEPADVFLQALASAGVVVGFDVEADVVPPQHDELILELAASTRGAFVVEAARQAWNLPAGVSEEDGVDDEEAEGSDYTVEFLHDGRVVAFRAGYSGD